MRSRRAPARSRRARPCRARRSPVSTAWPAIRSKAPANARCSRRRRRWPSAVSYVAAQLDLFADVSDFASRGNADLEPLLAGLRRAIETDRYGLVAHVLATRDGCTTEQCPALAMMRDAQRHERQSRAAHLRILRRAPCRGLAGDSAGPVANPRPARCPAPRVRCRRRRPPSRHRGRRGRDVFFPSSDSIPPVNIMTAEPGRDRPRPRAPRRRATPRRGAPAQKRPSPSSSAPIDLNAAARARRTAGARSNSSLRITAAAAGDVRRRR